MTTEAAPFAAPAIQELAALFPGYSIDTLIACGGMGAVYHGRQIALDREVAIKILPREFSSDAEFRDGFAAEARAMARLNHPNLIGVYDFGEVDGMLFIIMEFVPGQSLYHAAYGIAVEPREAARLMSEICNGIAEAHRHGILHRDIKPANVLLDAHMRPKVGDFGLARPLGHAAAEGEAIFGTPNFTAPEVVNNPSQVDARADIFSLGVMLHELLTSKLPSADPRPPSAISGCSPKFDEIVKRATQPLPALRYPDALSMARDLAALAVAPAAAAVPQAGMARPPAVRRPPARRVQVKASNGFSWGWVLLILGVAALGYYAYKSRQTPPTAGPAPRVEQSGSSVDLSKLNPDALTAKPAQKADLPSLDGGGSGAAGGNSKGSGGPANVFGTLQPTGEVATTTAAAEGPKPIADVDGFFKRARGVMKTKAQSVRAARDRALSDSIATFDTEVTKIARNQNAAAVKATAEVMQGIRDAGYRIPDRNFEIPGVSEKAYGELYAAAIKREEAIDIAYYKALKPHAETYIQGIEVQIDKALADKDVGALNALKEEISSVKTDDSYFASVIEK
jgi:serine/threonine protein kinase